MTPPCLLSFPSNQHATSVLPCHFMMFSPIIFNYHPANCKKQVFIIVLCHSTQQVILMKEILTQQVIHRQHA